MRSLGVADGGERPRSRGGALDKKIDNFLPNRPASGIVLQKLMQARLAFSAGPTGGLWRSPEGNDSEMAPQIIEIARNGLGMVIRQLRCPSEGVSIKRTV
jgi:hypothetical protein